MSVDTFLPEVRFQNFLKEWTTRKLGELGKVATNKRIFIHQTSTTGDVPFFKIGTFGREPKLFISQELFDRYKKQFPHPEKGDLLFSVIGSIGRVVEYSGEDEYFQDSNIVWLQHNGAIDNAFLKQFYSIVVWSGLEGSTIQHLYNRNILETQITLPCKEEQAQIGDYFQKLDNLISQHQQKHDKLSNLKKAMLDKMFPKSGETTPETRFKGFVGEWSMCRIGDIANCFAGGTPPVGVDVYYRGKIPFIRSAEINKTSTEINISEAGLENSSAKIVEVGTVLYALYGATSGEVGRSRINGAINQAILAIIPKPEICPEFLSHWLRKNKKGILSRYLQGGQGNLSGDIVKNLIVQLPEFDEQRAIGNYFQKLDMLISQQQQQITKLNNIKQACLNKMFV